jgi:pimeloyl-ACP methyl ester carboxylesterase
VSKLRVNGITMNYELTGQGDCLVLVHGAGDSLRMWYGQVPEFSRHCRVLTYDIRGFGETELGDSDVDISLLAADLRELLRALAIDSAFVLGHSMGGRIALQLAVEQPEMVKALVLSSSGVGLGARPPGADEKRQQLIEALDRGDLETAAERMTELSFSHGLRERDSALFERYKQIKLGNDPSAFARVWLAVMQSPPSEVSRLRYPVLIIAGDRDAFMSVDMAKASQAAIPGSRLVLLPMGHTPALEAPREFNRMVLDFLAEVRRREST